MQGDRRGCHLQLNEGEEVATSYVEEDMQHEGCLRSSSLP